MVFCNIDAENKDANKSRLKAYMIKDRPGAIGFTSGFSQENISITVGEKNYCRAIDRKANNYEII